MQHLHAGATFHSTNPGVFSWRFPPPRWFPPQNVELLALCVGAGAQVCAGFGATAIVLGAPLAFGVAHAHHCYGEIRDGMPVSVTPPAFNEALCHRHI